MWDLPGPEIEPVSPALAGGFLTTAPPGKPLSPVLKFQPPASILFLPASFLFCFFFSTFCYLVYIFFMLFLPIEYKLPEGREFFSWVYSYIPRTVSAIIELYIHVWMNSVYHSLQVYLLTCCLPSPINLGVSGKQEIHPFIHHSSQILAWCLATKSFICESMNTNNNFACVLQLSL